VCLAIPLGNKEDNNESELWRTIRTNPTYLLSIGFAMQSIMAIAFFLGIESGIIASVLIIKPALILLYALSFGIGGFVFFTLSMHYVPKMLHTGNIEYLYYGGFFYLAGYNMVIFYVASLLSFNLLIVSAIVHLLLMLFAFKPIWHAYFWTDKRYKFIGLIVNTFLILLFVSQLMIVWLILNS